MTAAVTIRPLTPDDLPAAMAIQSAVFEAFLVEPADAFASRLDVRVPVCFAAEREGELLGYVLAHGWPRRSPPPVGMVLSPDTPSEALFIHDLAVGPAGRGLGLGEKLVEAAFALAARHTLTIAELIAVDGAAQYWRKLGFAEEPVSEELRAKVAGYGPRARWMTRGIPAKVGD